MNETFALIAEFTRKYPGIDDQIEAILGNQKNNGAFLQLPFLHNIGQPIKTQMLCLFIAHALKKPDQQVQTLAAQVISSLESALLARESTLKMRWNALNLLGQQQIWPALFNNATQILEPLKTAQHEKSGEPLYTPAPKKTPPSPRALASTATPVLSFS